MVRAVPCCLQQRCKQQRVALRGKCVNLQITAAEAAMLRYSFPCSLVLCRLDDIPNTSLELLVG